MKPLKREALDQLIHFAAAFAVVALAEAVDSRISLAAGALVGFALGNVREITEGGDPTSPGSLRDLFFWTLGGAVAGWAL